MKRSLSELIGDINLYLEECDNDTIVQVYNLLSQKKASIIEDDVFNFEVEE